ncbi:MAG: YbaB/EbfC family nucleoid-associated protein [Solirubrobacteraceae bacterium]|nr:YbaB/EbfC family nucleoid-associated protein [Solirubrobacteraceae bacterium]
MPQPNMNEMLQQVQKMQADMAAAQAALKNEVIETTAGGGAVKVAITGELVIQSITIDPAAIDPEDPELLSDTLVAALNQAIAQAQEVATAKMSAASGDLGAMGKSLGLGF